MRPRNSPGSLGEWTGLFLTGIRNIFLRLSRPQLENDSDFYVPALSIKLQLLSHP